MPGDREHLRAMRLLPFPAAVLSLTLIVNLWPEEGESSP
jgi:hypothetical protein